MIKLIISDIGGVLVDFMEEMYISYLHEKALPGISIRRLEKFIMPLVPLMEYGELSVPELEDMVAKHFGIKGLDLQWVQGFRKVARPKIKEMELINVLNERYRTVLLTNVSQSRFAEIKRNYLNMINVRTAYKSYEMQMRKPGPHIYNYVLSKERVRPREAVFIDNQIENVIGAEKVGIHAIWYRNHRKLLQDLAELGITP